MKRIFQGLLLTLLFSMVALVAIPQVNQRAYRWFLQRALKHKVPEVQVQHSSSDSSVLYLDAREQEEFAVSHLPGARCIGYEHFDEAAVAGLKKDQPIVVYCSVGIRSERIAERLITMGFTNVSNLYGGLFEWVNQEQSLVNEEGKHTKRVHGYNRLWSIWLRKGEKVYQ